MTPKSGTVTSVLYHPFSQHTGTLHFRLESCSTVLRGCVAWVLSSTLHPVAGSRFTDHLFFCFPPQAQGSNSPQLSAQTPHFPLSDETPVAQNPLSLWEIPGKHQETGKWAAGTTQDLSKRENEGQTRNSLCFSKKDDSGDYSDSSRSLSNLWWLVSAPQQQCFATATQQARKSKQKPSLPPQGQI